MGIKSVNYKFLDKPIYVKLPIVILELLILVSGIASVLIITTAIILNKNLQTFINAQNFIIFCAISLLLLSLIRIISDTIRKLITGNFKEKFLIFALLGIQIMYACWKYKLYHK